MLRLPLPGSPTVADVLRAVRDEERPFALVGRWAGSRAIVGAAPVQVVDGTFPPDLPTAAGDGADTFVGGGWFGTLGFGLAWDVERLPPAPPRPAPVPVSSLGLHEWVARCDEEGVWWFEALEDTPAARARHAWLVAALAAPAQARPWALDGMTLHGGGADAHRAAVAECVERIAAGELFQANLCLRLDGRLTGDPAEAFLVGVAALEPAYGAYFGRDDGAVLSFSPELFLRRAGRSVVTAPIKGTAPRTPEARAALVASAKDAAEHVMIVDLMRNDLGRVAEYGTVVADPAPAVEPHPGLWHLVGRVRATLREDVGDAELLRATFPPGSVTGAPKVQALKVISELEGTAREAYTGAIGLISPHAGLELNVAIRTLEVRGEDAWLGCGGGIVADSEPGAELVEALGKARPIVEALGGTVPDETCLAPSTWKVPGTFHPRLRRPRPGDGILETLAVVDGVPAALERHLARVIASVRGVYGVDVDPRAAILAAAEAAGPGRRRMRIVVAPDGDVAVETLPAPPGPPADVLLRPVTVTGGLGAHKWVDRPAEPDMLVVDLDGSVLESGSANVWVVEGETLVTPPADGRLLAGMTRERLLELDPARCSEGWLDLDRLRSADGVVLTSSIRLATPAGLDAVTQRAREVAAELRGVLGAPAAFPTPGQWARQTS